MIALIVTTRKRVLLGTLSMRSDKLVTDLTMHPNSPFTCMIILTSIFALFYLFSSYQPSMQYSVNFEETILDQINSSFPITFYHNAYVDYRFTPPRLRIFSLNQCIKPNKNFLLVDIFYEGVSEPTQMKVFGEPLEGACPSTYGPAKPCFYVAHTFFTDLIMTGGMTKVLLHMAQVHWAKSFTDSSKKSKGGDGGLLHLRYGFDPSKEKTVEKQFRFFPNNQKEHIRNMQDTANKIFNGSVPTFNSNFIDTLNDCVKQINKRGKTCRSTGGMCKKEMDKVNEWVYDKTEGIFLSGA
ncbi:hypothetical protein L5515_006135 [Caenorhabditis briggsae]|uniref:Uncharacterized protein n=1 Tax=Caenorhabditis briggsae TaxID=6238 RepID=A0AAE9EV78_CAEBR|nr:hypothetical protein L5515_006135 [Caenorhabditis briggsae]